MQKIDLLLLVGNNTIYITNPTLFPLTFYARDKATAEEEEYQEDEIFDGK
jgi:hypothetical protein